MTMSCESFSFKGNSVWDCENETIALFFLCFFCVYDIGFYGMNEWEIEKVVSSGYRLCFALHVSRSIANW
jgi:hypothetical protein